MTEFTKHEDIFDCGLYDQYGELIAESKFILTADRHDNNFYNAKVKDYFGDNNINAIIAAYPYLEEMITFYIIDGGDGVISFCLSDNDVTPTDMLTGEYGIDYNDIKFVFNAGRSD